MATISAYKEGRSHTKTNRWWLPVMVALAVMLASTVVATATAQAGSFDNLPPRALLIKPSQVLQEGKLGSSVWSHYYKDGRWISGSVDTLGYSFPRADVVGAGPKLHIRLDKPQRPESFSISAYKGFDREQGRPIGESRRLDTTLRRVERDGKTVGWDVFFRVKHPDRHYYMVAYGTWKPVPDTHISYGQGEWFFHIKTH
jgi:hypothetical protein